MLSKRWSYIWVTIPILVFHEWACLYSRTDPKTVKFIDFVDGTFRRRQGNIQCLSITWLKHLNEDMVNLWITSAASHNVQQLSLHLSLDKLLFVTQSLFTCESLISLKLHVRPNPRFPNFIVLPKLKCLELCYVEFSCESWNKNLFSRRSHY